MEDDIMNWKTKYKVLEENLFADMVVMVGRYMKYKAKNRSFRLRNDTILFLEICYGLHNRK